MGYQTKVLEIIFKLHGQYQLKKYMYYLMYLCTMVNIWFTDNVTYYSENWYTFPALVKNLYMYSIRNNYKLMCTHIMHLSIAEKALRKKFLINFLY